ncbi:MAG TPA: hypothetical protein H9837_02325 [Candidatus Brachybacterium merdigallinarum]|nr:hypothetical protein [Candidatus Brachybacterium merdigallinarum]
MRPEAPFYVGTTQPGGVGWMRIAVTIGAGLVMILLLITRDIQPLIPLAALVVAAFALFTLVTWMRQSTRFIVDDRGLTVSLGGFLPRSPWPLADFRTVQLRTIPAERVGVTVGGYGWRTGRVTSSQPGELQPVGSRKIFTTGETSERYRTLVTRPGTMVEIIGRSGTHYLISPQDPQATADAVDQAIRARR